MPFFHLNSCTCKAVKDIPKRINLKYYIPKKTVATDFRLDLG